MQFINQRAIAIYVAPEQSEDTMTTARGFITDITDWTSSLTYFMINYNNRY